MGICVQEGPLSNEYLLRSVCGGDWDPGGVCSASVPTVWETKRIYLRCRGKFVCVFKTGEKLEEIA